MHRPGALLLAPTEEHPRWTLVEIDADLLDAVHIPPAVYADEPPATEFDSLASALSAAFDLLTLVANGRLPAMHEHTQESVQEFICSLEQRGYSRERAIELLLQVVDDLSARSPIPAARATEGRPREPQLRRVG